MTGMHIHPTYGEDRYVTALVGGEHGLRTLIVGALTLVVGAA